MQARRNEALDGFSPLSVSKKKVLQQLSFKVIIRNLQIFVTSKSVRPWQAFPV
jgi:hypothetical protein